MHRPCAAVASSLRLILQRQSAYRGRLQFPFPSPRASSRLLRGVSRLDLDHPVYDCFYLALAIQEQLPVATADQRFYDVVCKRCYPSDRIVHVESLESSRNPVPRCLKGIGSASSGRVDDNVSTIRGTVGRPFAPLISPPAASTTRM